LSTIPSIPKQTITSHFKPLNITKTPTYDVGNADPDLVQAQKYGGVKPVNWIPALLS
jgi:hypothetical protein